MRLIMFDIDGTLTDTNEVDSRCFVPALQEAFGFVKVDDDWSHYTQSTDSGIIDELFQIRERRAASAGELARFQSRFVELLNAAADDDPRAFKPIAGAQEALERLRGGPDTAVALATGGWAKSARLKLERAGLGALRVPAAFADDAHAREDIMRCSLARACEHHQQRSFDAVIYVGDRPWDLRAATKLGFKFIGIARDADAARLRAESATHVFADYLELDSFLNAVEALAGASRQ